MLPSAWFCLVDDLGAGRSPGSLRNRDLRRTACNAQPVSREMQSCDLDCWRNLFGPQLHLKVERTLIPPKAPTRCPDQRRGTKAKRCSKPRDKFRGDKGTPSARVRKRDKVLQESNARRRRKHKSPKAKLVRPKPATPAKTRVTVTLKLPGCSPVRGVAASTAEAEKKAAAKFRSMLHSSPGSSEDFQSKQTLEKNLAKMLARARKHYNFSSSLLTGACRHCNFTSLPDEDACHDNLELLNAIFLAWLNQEGNSTPEEDP